LIELAIWMRYAVQTGVKWRKKLRNSPRTDIESVEHHGSARKAQTEHENRNHSAMGSTSLF